MKNFVAIVAVALSFAAVVLGDCSDASGGCAPLYFENLRSIDAELSLDDICYEIGLNSGCSGCFLGTKKGDHLCTWIKEDYNECKKRGTEDCKKRAAGFKFGPEGGTIFSCVSRQTANRLFVRKEAQNASKLCPVNSRDEPIIRDRLVTPDGKLSYAQASEVSSVWIETNLAEFPDTGARSWAVDRTSAWGPAGWLTLAGALEEYPQDCAYLTSVDRIDLDAEGDDSPVIHGYLKDERDRFCAKVILNAWLSTRCIEYGKAVSGICKSFYDRIQLNCNYATIPSPDSENRTHVCPPRGRVESAFEQPLPLVGLKAVPDNTPFCLNSETDFPIIASRKLEEIAHLHDTIEELAARPHRYSDDDCGTTPKPPSPSGYCCIPDGDRKRVVDEMEIVYGTCQTSLEIDCSHYFSLTEAGCDSNCPAAPPPPVNGYCCIPDTTKRGVSDDSTVYGTCQVSTDVTCAYTFSTTQGDCETGCPAAPPPPPVNGYCCIPDTTKRDASNDLTVYGTCQVSTDTNCAYTFSTTQGACETGCPTAPPPPVNGYCCIPDTTKRDASNDLTVYGTCQVSTNTNCAYTFSATQGDCETGCPAAPPPPTSGYCCIPDVAKRTVADGEIVSESETAYGTCQASMSDTCNFAFSATQTACETGCPSAPTTGWCCSLGRKRDASAIDESQATCYSSDQASCADHFDIDETSCNTWCNP